MSLDCHTLEGVAFVSSLFVAAFAKAFIFATTVCAFMPVPIKNISIRKRVNLFLIIIEMIIDYNFMI